MSGWRKLSLLPINISSFFLRRHFYFAYVHFLWYLWLFFISKDLDWVCLMDKVWICLMDEVWLCLIDEVWAYLMEEVWVYLTDEVWICLMDEIWSCLMDEVWICLMVEIWICLMAEIINRVSCDQICLTVDGFVLHMIK